MSAPVKPRDELAGISLFELASGLGLALGIAFASTEEICSLAADDEVTAAPGGVIVVLSGLAAEKTFAEKARSFGGAESLPDSVWLVIGGAAVCGLATACSAADVAALFESMFGSTADKKDCKAEGAASTDICAPTGEDEALVTALAAAGKSTTGIVANARLRGSALAAGAVTAGGVTAGGMIAGGMIAGGMTGKSRANSDVESAACESFASGFAPCTLGDGRTPAGIPVVISAAGSIAAL
ncbi:MAG TPA: hypothetical protein VMH04_14150 [Candidatus Solibacter sp.]|nr:hypothetical protein [Candidatus Solibacter sp.]